MRISVFIPCYNEEKYLDDCLTSLSKQTLLPDEVILCDNNSSDNSVLVANKYKKKLNLIVINETKQGIMPTVEKAWRATTGDILIRTDADAVFPPQWIEKIIGHFNDDPKLAACGGDWVPYQENFFWKIVTKLGFDLGNIVLPITKGYVYLFGPNTAIRRQVMEKINGYVTDDPYIVDDQLLSQKLYQNKLKFARFSDCWNYHSARRYHQGIINLVRYAASCVFPRLYLEKAS
jgi:glycosyltransferase involved in cell wall biosynthesis